MNALGGRKAAMTWFILVSATAGFGFGTLTESGYITIVTLVFGGYVIGNITNKKVLK